MERIYFIILCWILPCYFTTYKLQTRAIQVSSGFGFWVFHFTARLVMLCRVQLKKWLFKPCLHLYSAIPSIHQPWKEGEWEIDDMGFWHIMLGFWDTMASPFLRLLTGFTSNHLVNLHAKVSPSLSPSKSNTLPFLSFLVVKASLPLNSTYLKRTKKSPHDLLLFWSSV
jgi:hypothetical protein